MGISTVISLYSCRQCSATGISTVLSLYYSPHLVGAQLCRLSPVDAHTVGLKLVNGK